MELDEEGILNFYWNEEALFELKTKDDVKNFQKIDENSFEFKGKVCRFDSQTEDNTLHSFTELEEAFSKLPAVQTNPSSPSSVSFLASSLKSFGMPLFSELIQKKK